MLAEATLNPHVFDCHLLPQYNFARFASIIVPYPCYDIFSQNLTKFYGLEEVSFPELHEKYASVHDRWASNTSHEIDSLIREFYSVDYAYLGHFF